MAKIYTEEQKYGGINESLNYKLTIFYNICNRADVPQEAYLKAFPTMLKGLALDHFYINQLSRLPFAKACEHLWNFFKELGFQRKNLDKWNTIILTTVIAENIDKSISECL